MTQITPTDHSDIVGGSTAARVIACPASVKLVQSVRKAHKERILTMLVDRLGLSPSLSYDNMPTKIAEQVEALYKEETSNQYTKEGTSLHEAIAWILENDEEGESVIDREFEGMYITASLYAECIAPALEAFDKHLDRVFEEDGEDLEFQVEQRGEIPGVPGAFGTSDIFGCTSKRIVIKDWKFGVGLVEDVTQLKFYASALAHAKSDWIKERLVDTDVNGNPAANTPVDLVIIQPRRRDSEPYVVTVTFAEIEAFRMELIHAVSEALGDNPQATRGAHCKYCDAKHVCPAFQQIGSRVMDRIGDAIDMHPPEDCDNIDDIALDDVKESIRLDTQQFTPEDLDQWVQDAVEIRIWCDHIMNLAFSEGCSGRPPTGMKVIHGRSTEKWNEDYDFIDKRLGALGISVKDRRKIKNITPKQARKFIEDDKKLARLDKLTDESDGPLKLVYEEEKGEPVTPNAKRVEEVGVKIKDFTGQ